MSTFSMDAGSAFDSSIHLFTSQKGGEWTERRFKTKPTVKWRHQRRLLQRCHYCGISISGVNDWPVDLSFSNERTGLRHHLDELVNRFRPTPAGTHPLSADWLRKPGVPVNCIVGDRICRFSFRTLVCLFVYFLGNF